ncbi:methyl-accepting chemotaxis protein [Vibrio sp.]|nr:methyl-accepting chemotaxis protein [Vibrio sp.]
MLKKIFTYASILLLILASIFVFVSYNFSSVVTEKNIKKANDLALNISIGLYEDAYTSLREDVKSLASMVVAENKTSLVDGLKDLQSINTRYIDVFYADTRGQVWAASLNGLVNGFNAQDANRTWFNEVIRNKQPYYITEAYVGNSGSINITAVAPVIKNNTIQGLVGVDVNLDKLLPRNDLELAVTDQQGSVFITDEINSGWVGKNIFDIRGVFKEATVDPMLYKNDQEKWFSVSRNELDDGRLLWVMASQDELISQRQTSFMITVLIGLSVGILIMLGCLFIVRKELENLPTFVTSIKKMANGHFNSLTFPKSKNELDDVANSLLLLQAEVASVMQSSKEVMSSLSDSQTQISGVIQHNISNAQKEFSEVEQVATAATELSATATEVAEKAQNAEDATSSTMSVLNESNEALTRSDEISQRVSSTMHESAEIVNELREHSDQISSVLDVINGISEQINLLALNAAIEAARAGEHGRGFAVVADEVRALAGKTQKATVDIQDIISQLQQQSHKADDYMGKNTELVKEFQGIATEITNAFSIIAGKVHEVSDINAMVATASEEQSAVTQDISQRLEELNHLVQINMENTERTDQANKEISSLTNTLNKELSYFKVN